MCQGDQTLSTGSDESVKGLARNTSMAPHLKISVTRENSTIICVYCFFLLTIYALHLLLTALIDSQGGSSELIRIITRKLVPITGRARSFLLVFKNKIERRGRQNKNNRPINLLNGKTFSTYFKYTTQS